MADDAPELRGEVRKLSSVNTEAGEMLGVVFCGLALVAAIASIVARNLELTLVFLGVGAVLGRFVLFGGGLIVETDGYWLLASDRSKTVWIPLREVVSVERVWWGRGSRVQVELGCDTPFGREFTFEPRLELGALVGQHPVVEEIRELAARAKAAHSRPGSRAS